MAGSIKGLAQRSVAIAIAILFSATSPCAFLRAQGSGKKNPVGKVYFADVNGGAQINDGKTTKELGSRSAHRAQGTVIETKKSEVAGAGEKSSLTLVYSNGSAAYLDHETRIEIRKFAQEPFQPNRTDMAVEPSISQTETFVANGTVAVATGTSVAGSSMIYKTRDCTINVRGTKFIIETEDGVSRVSMLEGESTIRAGDLDIGGTIVKQGQQFIVRSGDPGKPKIVEVLPIPQAMLNSFKDRIEIAQMAKRSVFFDVREIRVGAGSERASSVGSSGADTPTANVFDEVFTDTGSANFGSTRQEIIPLPVVPSKLPVQFTVSPAVL